MGPCKKIGGMVISVVLMSSSLRHQGSRQRRTLPGVGSYWARPVSIFNINLPSSLLLQFIRGSIIFKGSRVSKVLDFYRVYCTKQNLRPYHTIIREISRNGSSKPTTCI